ncbi:7TM diverse intracellular signaling domain-containing protein [Bernardetia sp.]|uniref:7TM diverse intracellular signaling domain-containing protein n=1 Tax=Bernardetia sp. TaxID=1937974 RepID=UPI0025C5C6DE|nr:7TM diverse intracellular signaling domain-containing protein [Bernardetia sp.]
MTTIFLCLPYSILAQSISFISLDKKQDYSIANRIGIYRADKEKKETIESIQEIDFVTEPNKFININGATQKIWLKIPLKNKTNLKDWYLEVGSGRANVEVFIPNSDNSYKKIELGYGKPFSERILQTDRFIIPLEIDENEEIMLFVSIESNYFQGPIHVAPWEYYFERDHKVDLAEGMYYGFILVMLLYNLFLYFTLREKGYLYYIIYLLTLGLGIAQIRGHSFEFLWGNQPWVNDYDPIIYAVSSIFANLFFMDFLHTKRHAIVFHRILQALIGIFVIIIIIVLFGHKALGSSINQVLLGFSCLNGLATALYIYYKGYKPAKYIIVAWTSYLAGLFIFVLAGAGIIVYNDFTSSGLLLGSAIEVVVLSVALAAKIDFYKKKQAELQAQMLKSSEEHREFVETQNKRLEERVAERTEELNVVNEELSVNLERLNEQNITIAKKNQDITASINYAKRIQDAMLPTLEEIKTGFPNSFVFFEPRDIVSGDFYFYRQINNKIIIGAIDCTGHGVPGAFMSLIGNDLLNEIVESKSVTKVSHILDRLDKGITKVLRQTDTQIRDGMDVAFCVYDTQTGEIEYAGARNPLIYIEGEELKVIKADRQSIGGSLIKNQFHKQEFTTHNIKLKENTNYSFYLFTDGYQDQFGGGNDKKFTTKRLRNTLLETSKLPFSEQEDFLRQTLKDWMGYTNKQIDDILIVGFEPNRK